MNLLYPASLDTPPTNQMPRKTVHLGVTRTYLTYMVMHDLIIPPEQDFQTLVDKLSVDIETVSLLALTDFDFGCFPAALLCFRGDLRKGTVFLAIEIRLRCIKRVIVKSIKSRRCSEAKFCVWDLQSHRLFAKTCRNSRKAAAPAKRRKNIRRTATLSSPNFWVRRHLR
jgi:hypothetical protein